MNSNYTTYIYNPETIFEIKSVKFDILIIFLVVTNPSQIILMARSFEELNTLIEIADSTKDDKILAFRYQEYLLKKEQNREEDQSI